MDGCGSEFHRASAVTIESMYWYELKAGNKPRFKDPPPADMKPDPDFVPEVGEWFWWKSWDRGWVLRECKSDGMVYNEMGRRGSCSDRKAYKGLSLPATPPE